MGGLLNRADKLLGLLTRPSAHRVLALLAMLLCAPSLAGGLVLDDHVLALGARSDGSVPGLHPAPLSLFRFTTGRSEDNLALMDHGALLPWWSDPQHLNAFLRPLSSLTHDLDFALFPNAPWLMHLHSLLWFAALVLGVSHIFLRIEGGRTAVAGLALLLFVVDEAHGMTVAWIANRNALIATTLALPALGAHARWASGRDARGWKLAVGPACFALGLCAGETAVAVLGYLGAYALVLGEKPLWRRLLALWPYGVVLVAWRIVFSKLGLGSAGSGAYHDPLHEPLGYLQALVQHVPVLLGSQLGVPVADLWFWGPPEAQTALWLLAGAMMLGVLALAHVLLRDNAHARFWMFGMVLSTLAVAASVPGERLLLVPSIGGAALLAHVMIALLERLRAESSVGLPLGLARASLVLLALVHIPAAAFGLPPRAASLGLLGSTIARAERNIPSDASVRDRAVVILNAPFDVLFSYVQVARAAEQRPRPAHLWWLGTASSALQVTRVDDRTLRVQPERGYVWSASERHYRGNPRALPLGAEVKLSRMHARVVALTEDGRPAAAELRFDVPLEHESLLLLQYAHGELSPFVLPAIGQHRRMPAESFFDTLSAHVRNALLAAPSPATSR